MRKINLLYIITKLELGGAQKQLLSLIKGLDKEKYNVLLFTASDGFLMDEAFFVRGLSVKRSRFLERSINPVLDILALFELYIYIMRNSIDIVHTHSSKAGIVGRWAARLAGVRRIIHTVHGWSFNDHQFSIERHIFRWLERRMAGFTDALIVVSKHDRDEGLRNKIGREDAYRLVRYGIDHEDFHGKRDPAGIRAELGIKDGEAAIGTISCLKPQKSPEDFVKLASLVRKDVPGVKFLLAGDGVLRADVERLIRKYDLADSLMLLGWRRDIPEILSALDVFVLTSLWEGLPITVLESMAASCPVVVTDTGGVGEVVEDGRNGFLVGRRDVEKMSDRVVGLLKDASGRGRMARYARSSLDGRFTTRSMVESTSAIYDELSARHDN